MPLNFFVPQPVPFNIWGEILFSCNVTDLEYCTGNNFGGPSVSIVGTKCKGYNRFVPCFGVKEEPPDVILMQNVLKGALCNIFDKTPSFDIKTKPPDILGEF